VERIQRPRKPQDIPWKQNAPMIDQTDTYAIVILGGMNPRIHHPSWYRLVGLFDEEEAEQATRTPNTLITPLVAQIQSPRLTILCQDDRWEIRTTDLGQVDRIQSITARLFDELLPHTPVAAAGFNFTYWKASRASDVGSLLASTLIGTPLGLKPDNAVAGEIVLRRNHGDHTSQVRLRPVLEEHQKLMLDFNFEYRFQAAGFFKLGQVITERYGVDRGEAEAQAALILKAINQMARG
jgi:hypothetical protein